MSANAPTMKLPPRSIYTTAIQGFAQQRFRTRPKLLSERFAKPEDFRLYHCEFCPHPFSQHLEPIDVDGKRSRAMCGGCIADEIKGEGVDGGGFHSLKPVRSIVPGRTSQIWSAMILGDLGLDGNRICLCGDQATEHKLAQGPKREGQIASYATCEKCECVDYVKPLIWNGAPAASIAKQRQRSR